MLRRHGATLLMPTILFRESRPSGILFVYSFSLPRSRTPASVVSAVCQHSFRLVFSQLNSAWLQLKRIRIQSFVWARKVEKARRFNPFHAQFLKNYSLLPHVHFSVVVGLLCFALRNWPVSEENMRIQKRTEIERLLLLLLAAFLSFRMQAATSPVSRRHGERKNNQNAQFSSFRKLYFHVIRMNSQ